MNILSILFYTIISFLFLEFFVRLLYFLKTNKRTLRLVDPTGKGAYFKTHPYCFYVKCEDNEGTYPSNSLGHVGKVEPAAKTKNDAIKLYFVGGSTTEEIDLSQGPDSHWPALYTRKLAAHVSNIKFEYMNAACSGYTSAESLSEFLYRGLALQPDYLFIYHNVNDAWTVQMRRNFKSDYSSARIVGRLKKPLLARIPQMPVSYLYQLLRRRLMSGFVHRGLMYYISDPPWLCDKDFDERRVDPFKRNIINLVHISRLWKCTPIIINWERASEITFRTSLYSCESTDYEEIYNKYVDANNVALKEIADSYNVKYYNIGPLPDHCFQSDGMHFTRIGREEFSHRLFEASKDMIAAELRMARH